MKRRIAGWTFVLFVMIGLAVVLALDHPELGALLRREHYCDGGPSSAWSKEIQTWDLPPGLEFMTAPGVVNPLVHGEPGAVGVLTDLLRDKDPIVRAYAAYALGVLGTKAGEAAPALRDSLSDPDETVRQLAAVALQSLDSQTSTTGDMK